MTTDAELRRLLASDGDRRTPLSSFVAEQWLADREAASAVAAIAAELLADFNVQCRWEVACNQCPPCRAHNALLRFRDRERKWRAGEGEK